jgi:multiple sugar transport system substrate-binding protein
MWSQETEPERVTATERILAGFTRRTGIKVKLVPMQEDQFRQVIGGAVAAGRMPDVLGSIPLTTIQMLAANELVNTAAVQQVLAGLGPQTFEPSALRLTKYGGRPAAIPSDGFTGLLLYRKDLFEQAGLEPPGSYEQIRQAAQRLTASGRAGIVVPTAPADVFTAQTFEYLAQANGCQLTDQAGRLALRSPACVGAFRFYGDLARNFSQRGNQDVDTVRAAYLSGQAAMIPWSSYILDELAGLRDDALPTCPQCRADRLFLARNTGMVTALRDPSGRQVATGEISSWTITADASVEDAKALVTYMMSEGYENWMSFAPEGKIPARRGTAEQPNRFRDAWPTLPAGVDRKERLDRIYPAELIEVLRSGQAQYVRWGVAEGQGELAAALLGDLPVPKAISSMSGGGLSPERAAAQAQREIESIQNSIGR